MGKARMNMELIANEKSRSATFKKRKDGLMKKMHEFTTLCGVSACMIIYGPDHAEPDIWPPDADEVRRVIHLYKSKRHDYNKNTGVPEFFRNRKRRIEEELEKLRRKNREAKYPTGTEFLDALDELQLREFTAALRVKSARIRSRVEFFRRIREALGTGAINQHAQGAAIEMHPPIHRHLTPPPPMPMSPQEAAMDHSHYLHQELHNRPTSMVMLMMDEDKPVGGYNGIYEAAPTPPPAACVVDHQVFRQNSMTMAMYYEMPPVPSVAPFGMQYRVVHSLHPQPPPPAPLPLPLQFYRRGEPETSRQGDGAEHIHNGKCHVI